MNCVKSKHALGVKKNKNCSILLGLHWRSDDWPSLSRDSCTISVLDTYLIQVKIIFEERERFQIERYWFLIRFISLTLNHCWGNYNAIINLSKVQSCIWERQWLYQRNKIQCLTRHKCLRGVTENSMPHIKGTSYDSCGNHYSEFPDFTHVNFSNNVTLM